MCESLLGSMLYSATDLVVTPQMSSVAEPVIGSLIGSWEAEGQLEGREEREG